MSTELRRSTGRGDKDKILLGFVLLWDVQRPRELHQCHVFGVFVLRLSSLLEGGVMMRNVEAIPIFQALGDFVI
jgi:hypothetical protein